MTYELAQQLYEAGFKKHYDDDGELRDPTLEELIEACGESFISLDRSDRGWLVSGFPLVPSNEADRGFMSELGSTPKEAVAKFYLALHRPKDIDV